MKYFQKRKRRTRDEEEHDDEPRRKRIEKKKENPSRKPKKLSKPWGKKERLLILILLVLTAGTSIALAFSSRAWKIPGLPRLKWPSISLPFFSDEKVVIEGDRNRARDREKSEEVIASFKEKTKNLSGVYGLYVVNLKTGFSYGVNEKEIFEPASLNKLPLMIAMYLQAEDGSLDLDTKYELKNSDKVSGSGSLFSKPEGSEFSYRELIEYMGKESDNTAFNIAKGILDEEFINETVYKVGMDDTVIMGEDQKTTPQDIGIFFEKAWAENLISAEHKDELLSYLTDTIYESWIPEGVPDTTRVSHKFGKETHVVNDAGIVFADDPFVLVILSKGVVEREADVVFPELAEMVHRLEVQ